MIKFIVLLLFIVEGYSRGISEADDIKWTKDDTVEPKDIVKEQKDQSRALVDLSECKECRESGKVNGKSLEGLKTKAKIPEQTSKPSVVSTRRPPRRKTKPFLTFHRIKVKVNSHKTTNTENPVKTVSAPSSEIKIDHQGVEKLSDKHSTNPLLESHQATLHLQSSEEAVKLESKNSQEGNVLDKQTVEDSSRKSLKTEAKHDSNADNHAHRGSKNSDTRTKNKFADDSEMQTDSHVGAFGSLDTVIQRNLENANEAKQKTKETSRHQENVKTDLQGDLHAQSTDRQRKKQAMTGKDASSPDRRDKNKQKTSSGNNPDKSDDGQGRGKDTFVQTADTREKSEPMQVDQVFAESNQGNPKSDGKTKGMETDVEKQVKEKMNDKPQDTTDSVDYILPAKAGDRWSRKDLKQVPDVERLERRLHPTVNAPVNDIMLSMTRILTILQKRLQDVDEDYDAIHNTTRWKYMMGVREHLSELAEENDQIYTVVMEASLLTKQIYRKAHERRHPQNGMEESAQRYRTQLGNSQRTFNPILRESYVKTQEELNKAQQLVNDITSSKSKKNALEQEVRRVYHMVRDRLPLRAMDDLYRRADQTMRIIASARPLSRSGDTSRLYSHMSNDTYYNMRRSRELLREAADFITEVKSEFMQSRQSVQKNHMMMHQTLRSNGVVTKMPFGAERMDHYVAVDETNYHANLLSDRAALIHMKLHDLVEKGKRLIADRSSINLERRLEKTILEMKNIVKDLVSTMDKIRVIIGDEDILRERCEEVDGSGWLGDDEDYFVINCDPYISYLPEGSGDDLEGSGDLEVPVDVNISTFTRTDSRKDNVTVDIDVTKDRDIGVSDKTKEDIILIDEDTDDEDMLKEISSKRSTSAATQLPSSTTPPPSTRSSTQTTTGTQKETTKKPDEETATDDFVFTDIFGWFNDQPDGEVNIGTGRGDRAKVSLNELIRKRLANYSQGSRQLLEEAKEKEARMHEISLTWDKVSGRFAVSENASIQARSALAEWRANRPYYATVHDRIQSVRKHVDLGAEVIDKQCKSAVDVAEKKLKTMTETYEKEKERSKGSADPEVVRETVSQVNVVRSGVDQIRRLKQVYPDPCGTLHRYDTKIRTNITELREKIERAKMIASTLQVAVSLPSDEYIELPIAKESSLEHPLTSNIQMVLRHSGSDGHLVSLQLGKKDSLSVTVAKDAVELRQSVDGTKKTTSVTSDNLSDKWYMLQLERFASLYNLTLFGEDGVSARVGLDLSSKASSIKHPTSLRVGRSEDLAVCAQRITINGQDVQMFGRNFTGVGLEPCTEQGGQRSHRQHILLDGSGQLVFRLSDILQARRLDRLLITFSPKSDGIVMLLESTQLTTSITVEVQNGSLWIQLRYFNYETSLQSTMQVYGSEQTLEILFSSGRGRNVNVLLNGKSNVFKAIQREVSSKYKYFKTEHLYVGGVENTTSYGFLVGCVKFISLNNVEVPFSSSLKGKGFHFGTCQTETCVIFGNESSPLEMTNLTTVNKLHVAVKNDSLGPVLQFSKHKEKFALTVSLDTEGLLIEETVKDNSERIPLPGGAKYIVLSIQDDSTAESVSLSVGDNTEAFSYKSGGAWGGWGGGEKKNNGPVSYSITVGASKDSDLPFLGTIQDLIVDGRPIDLMQHMEKNSLKYCTLDRAKQEEPAPTRKVERNCG